MKTCCFIGHRKVEETPELLERLRKTIKELICKNDVDTFLFGSKSQFDELCLKITKSRNKTYILPLTFPTYQCRI